MEFFKKHFWIIAFVIFLAGFFYPTAIKKLVPGGVDTIASFGETHQWLEYEKNTNEKALWNGAIFSGMPNYFRGEANALSVHKLIGYLGYIFSYYFINMLIGLFGFYWLLKNFKIRNSIAAWGAIAFVLFPHYTNLWLVGHASKFYALMWLPVVLVTFIRFLECPTILNLSLYSIAFSSQLITQHYQIIFYSIMFQFIIGIYQLIEKFINEPKNGLKFSLYFILSMIIVTLSFMYPLLSIKEYTPYSTRGGNKILLTNDSNNAKSNRDIEKEEKEKLEYAMNWSFSPKEFARLFIPNFFGGTSDEIYNGTKFSNLKGQPVPGYWGTMPFTQSSEYFGVFAVILFFMSFFIYKENKKLFISLYVLIVFSFLLSFGKHFPILYTFMYKYIPTFDKFRSPMTILTIIYPAILILGAITFEKIIENQNLNKRLIQLCIGFSLILILCLIFSNSFSYIAAGEETRYNSDTLNMLKEIRKEFLIHDTLRTLAFTIFLGINSFLLYKKILDKKYIIPLIIIFTLFDYSPIINRYYHRNELVNQKEMEEKYFVETAVEKKILEDKSIYRVLAVGKKFQDNTYAYRLNLVGGYNAAKLQNYQNLIDNNLFVTIDSLAPLNWNILKMLNAKYIITDMEVRHPNLESLGYDPSRNEYLYLNKKILNHFNWAKNVIPINDDAEVMKRLNNPRYNFPDTVYVDASSNYNKSYGQVEDNKIEVIKYELNRIHLKTSTKSDAFLVLSEVYYPIGWECKIDNNPTNIIKTNYILRGIEVPAGEHEITFEFMPKSYKVGNSLVWIGVILMYLTLILGLYLEKKKNKI